MAVGDLQSQQYLRAAFPNFAASPELHVLQLDPYREAAVVIGMSETDYRDASFLTEALATPERLGAPIPLFRVLEAVENAGETRPVHFIIHQGHTGSTLISRLLDEAGGFGLREPWALLTLAELYDKVGKPDSLVSEAEYGRIRDAMMGVWARRWRDGQQPVVKATSHAGRIGEDLLKSRTSSKALCLNLKPEPYLATLLAGENSPIDLRGFGPDRVRRTIAAFGDVTPPMHALSVGELAAMAWLIERESQWRLLHGDDLKTRALDVDFEAFLADPQAILSRIAAHFDMNPGENAIREAVNGPVMNRYSKATEHGYSADLRRQRLDEARRTMAGEIEKGLKWLENAAGNSPYAREILNDAA